MNMQKRDKAYLTHILESIEALARHQSRLQNSMLWFKDETVRDAMLRTLQIMSESCSRLSAESKALAPEVDWKNIAGFRNVITHDYLGDIDYARVSEVIERHIPQLQQSVSRIYRELYG